METNQKRRVQHWLYFQPLESIVCDLQNKCVFQIWQLYYYPQSRTLLHGSLTECRWALLLGYHQRKHRFLNWQKHESSSSKKQINTQQWITVHRPNTFNGDINSRSVTESSTKITFKPRNSWVTLFTPFQIAWARTRKVHSVLSLWRCCTLSYLLKIDISSILSNSETRK